MKREAGQGVGGAPGTPIAPFCEPLNCGSRCRQEAEFAGNEESIDADEDKDPDKPECRSCDAYSSHPGTASVSALGLTSRGDSASGAPLGEMPHIVLWCTARSRIRSGSLVFTSCADGIAASLADRAGAEGTLLAVIGKM